MRRTLLALAAVTALTACGTTAEPVWAPDEDVARATYVHDGPPAITLYTVLATRDGSGAHAGLMINGSQRVMFDPAGTWRHPRLPERNDVHYGMTPRMVNFYIDYHARETFDVVEHTVEVTPEIAELVMARAKAYGAVPKAQCTIAISSILRDVPGFEDLPRTWFPKKLMEAFAEKPGVTARRITDDDADNNHGVLLVQAGDPLLDTGAPVAAE
jgi:hypothetical protein